MPEDTSDDASKGDYVRFGVSNQHFSYLSWLLAYPVITHTHYM